LKIFLKISACRTGVGLLGYLHYIFYTEVINEMKAAVIRMKVNSLSELKLENIRHFIIDDVDHQKLQGLLFALMWFLFEKESYFKEKTKQIKKISIFFKNIFNILYYNFNKNFFFGLNTMFWPM
jgi:hypothetical protein